MGQHEPGVAAALADAAVDDRLVVRREEPVQLVEFGAAAELAAVPGRLAPRDRPRGRDVPAAQRAFLGVVGHVGALAGVLLRRTDVDQRLCAEDAQHIVLECADRRVVALDDGVTGGRLGRHVEVGVAAVGDPQVASAVEQSHVGVAEQGEHPQRVGGPPVALVAVDHDGVVAGDALAVHQLGELRAVDVVAYVRVVEVGVPVDLHRARDVAGVVEQHVLVGLDDGQPGPAEIARQPVGGDQAFRMGVIGQGGIGIGRQRHNCEPTHAAGEPVRRNQ